MKEVRLGQNSDHLQNQSGRAVHQAEAVNSHVNRDMMCRKWKYWVVSGKLFLQTTIAHALSGHLLPHFGISDTPPFKLCLSTPLHSPALLCQTADPNPMCRQGQPSSHKRSLFCCCLSLASYHRERKLSVQHLPLPGPVLPAFVLLLGKMLERPSTGCGITHKGDLLLMAKYQLHKFVLVPGPLWASLLRQRDVLPSRTDLKEATGDHVSLSPCCVSKSKPIPDTGPWCSQSPLSEPSSPTRLAPISQVPDPAEQAVISLTL